LSSPLWQPFLLCMGAMLPLMGCGFYVPKMQPFATDDPKAEGLKESSLTSFIKCELHFAVQQVLDTSKANDDATKKDPVNFPPRPGIDWLKTWGANVSLKMIVDENSQFSPGLSFNSPMENVISTFPTGGNVTSAQSFAFGIGASLSSRATRTENVSFYYPFADLLDEGPVTKEDCSKGKSSPATIDADLKIDDFIKSKYVAATVGGLLLNKPGVPRDGSVSPFLTFTYETQFIVTTSGNATPTWKLVHLSANANGPLFAAMRARTDDVLITMGEATKDEKGKTVPSSATQLQLQANLIGQAIASAVRNSQP
jgi:hypothetical protein